MEELEQLIQQAIKEEANSKAYQKLFTKIMSLMYQSGRIWKNYSSLDEDSYHNALVTTWKWLRIKLHNYDPEKGNIYSWFNTKLRYSFKDECNKEKTIQNRIVAPFFDSEIGEYIHPIDLIPAPAHQSNILEIVAHFLDDNHQELEALYPRNCPQGNCHYLLRQRVLLETPWDDLAQDLNSNAKTLNTHYQKKCRPYFISWLENQVYEL
ncbi:MAG: hypothetical protein AB4062_19255 [Crocosphaera sp.]